MQAVNDLTLRIKLNVGGRIFETTHDTLQKYPQSPLTLMINNGSKDDDGCYFIDRNPDIFSVVLDFYRTNLVRLPPNLHIDMLKLELEFWGIPYQKPQPVKTINSYFNLVAYHLQPLEPETFENLFVCQVYMSIYPAVSNKWKNVVVALDPPLTDNICHGLLCFYFNFVKIEFRHVPIDQKQCNIDGEIHSLISTNLTLEDTEARVAICKLF